MSSTQTTPATSRVRFSRIDEDGMKYTGELYVFVDGEQVGSIDKTGTPGYWGCYTLHGRYRGYFVTQREAKDHVRSVIA